MLTNFVSLDARAVRASRAVVDQVGVADLDRPTPCAGWTLRDLLAHMIGQHYGFAAAARGEADPDHWKPRDPGADPAAAYRAAAGHVLTAFGAAGPDFPLPELGRTFPAAQAVSFHFIDYVVHAWDVAKTLGVDLEIDPDLLGPALKVAEAVPGGQARLAPGASFGPRITWTGGTRLDEIVALLGRSPAWPTN
ncbi:TIGR03086 family metal-binding protein [Nonomuraea typhae]|uniref:TIGR03086 family metal-binding protein n=1 Tax=Nonomuraea typhae TaxID=2603600 RepID=A0ABW7YUK1_9ACTN